MGRNIFEKEDNPVILFLLLVYLGIGVKLMYTLHYYELSFSFGLIINSLYIFLSFGITYGIISYQPLTYLITLLTLTVFSCFGAAQIFMDNNISFLHSIEGWWNLAFGVVTIFLLWSSRHNYFGWHSKSSLLR